MTGYVLAVDRVAIVFIANSNISPQACSWRPCRQTIEELLAVSAAKIALDIISRQIE